MKRSILIYLAAAFALEPGTLCASTNPPPKLIVQDAPLTREVKAATSFAPVIKRVTPSVVNISSTMMVKGSQGRNPFSDDPLLRRFFGNDFGEQAQPRPRRAEGLGSGVIVSPDGYILTANHVVEGADKVKVALSSGEKEFEAKVIGTDPATDVALIRIDAKTNLPAVAIADSDRVEVGDTVLAVGSPFGLRQTVTMGIVSGLGRGGFGINGYEDFIQTDAAINPGNSGGALVDAEGRLVGINTAILSGSGGFMGVGFAVPINMARFVMDRIVTQGKVTRGYLGINIQPLTQELAKELRLPDESSGVLVGGAVEGGAAEKAGIKDGDVIVEFNGKKVTDPRTLQLLVAQTPPGTRVPVKVIRAEQRGAPTEKNVTVRLAELPREALASGQRDNPGEHGQTGTDALDGVEVTDLDARARKQFDIPASTRGALVTRVDPDSNAAEAGLRMGDVVLEIDRQPVHSADEAVTLSEKAKSERILLKVWSRPAGRGMGGTRYIVVDNSKRK
jgi:serine protease Do